MQVTPLSPIDWMLQHLQLLGWPTVVFAIYKLTRFLDKVLSRLESAEKNLDLLANNHFSHIEESLISIADTFERMEPSLSSMNTNIQILLDRADYRDMSKKNAEG